MKGILSLIVLSFVSVLCKAQNIVPNSGFESFNNCPTNWAQIDYSPSYSSFPTVQAWVSPLEKTTPDYYNACAAANSKVNIPNTFLGPHDAHTGVGCAGIISYQYSTSAGEYREYIQAKLKAPMIAGHRHQVSFYVSTNYDPANTNYNYIAVDRVGAAFTTSAINVTPDQYLMLDYSVVNPAGNYITSTTAWVKIEGTYIAQGGEEWITLGTFKNSSMPFSKVQLYPATPASGADYSYLYIDDVSVTDLDKIYVFTAVHDTAVCDANGLVLTSPITATSYAWNTGGNTQSITLNDSGTYWCRAKNGNSEFTDTFHVGRIYFHPSLYIGNDTLICTGDNFVLGKDWPLVTDYKWSTGSSSCCITPKETGKYFVTMSNGCDVLSDTINIASVACTDCFWAPTAFTPNADTKNDKFGVTPRCLTTKAKFLVVDRWGNEMFSTSDLTQKWDGTYKGQTMPIGIYNYLIEYWLLANKPKQVQKGDVLLLR